MNRQADAFHKPLHVNDSERQTHGCRHTNPDICAKNRIPKVCAFVRDDNLCVSPPQSWAKQYQRLKGER
jgi:hypothetical protein